METIEDIKQLISSPDKSDTERASLWNQLSALYIESDIDAAVTAADNALALALSAHDSYNAAESHESKAKISLKKNDNLDALFRFSEALKIWDELGDSVRLLALLKRMGNISLRSGNYPQAIEFYQRAIVQLKADGDVKGTADINTNLGIAYGFQGKYASSLKCHYEALYIYEEQQNTERLCRSLLNIGSVHNSQANSEEALKVYLRALQYSEDKDYKDISSTLYGNIGNIYKVLGDLLKAMEYQTKGLKVMEEIGDKSGLSTSYLSMGNIYNAQGDELKAIEYYNRSMSISEELRDKKGIIECNLAIGAQHEKEGEYNKAEPYIHKALKMAINIGAKASIRDAYKVMTLVYSEQKQFERAYEAQKKYFELDHELNNAAAAHQIAQITTQHAMEQKVRETEMERQKNAELNKAYNLVEEERKRSDALLLNILPARVASELKETGRTEPQSFDLVTVLFTDIKGFTELSEKLTAKELVELIDESVCAYDRIISKYPIEKLKIIGDAYMCAGGIPTANTTNPVDVVMAALDIQAYMVEFASEKKKKGLPHFDVRLGIHSGPAIAGVIGESKFAYDIWGDTVNIASRMESSGQAGKVNISGDTYALVKDIFDCTYRGKIEAKSKGLIDMYFVDGRRD